LTSHDPAADGAGSAAAPAVRALAVGSSASLVVVAAAHQYQLVVRLTVGQQLALHTSGTGTTRKAVPNWWAGHLICLVGRSGRFATTGRRVRFTMEVR
jgi:hypothetical protein